LHWISRKNRICRFSFEQNLEKKSSISMQNNLHCFQQPNMKIKTQCIEMGLDLVLR
jgi:hypothetical protein